MLKNIYSPLSGMIAQERVLDIIANNLANSSTAGFKGEAVSFKVLEPEPEKNYREPLPPANYQFDTLDIMKLKGNDMSYVGVSGVSHDFTQGSAIQTKNPFDLMIEGEGFLTAQTKEGFRYTRNGSLTLSPEGSLVDKEGNSILGEKGTIFLGAGKVTINHLGEVYQNDEFVDRLVVKNFNEKNLLEKIGSNYFVYKGDEKDVSDVEFPAMQQGFLEGSNVNIIKNLTHMILAQRSFEAYQKAVQNYDSMMEKSSNSIGVIRR